MHNLQIFFLAGTQDGEHKITEVLISDKIKVYNFSDYKYSMYLLCSYHNKRCNGFYEKRR